MVDFPPMHTLAASRKGNLEVVRLASLDYRHASMACASLARETREVGDELDALLDRIGNSGALALIRQHAAASRIHLPQANLSEAVRTLRIYAGILFQVSGKLARPTPTHQSEPVESLM